MFKKILIGLLIIVILGSSFAYYSYKKIEAQFESFILAEVEKKQAAATKALEDKLAAEIDASEAESSTEVVDEQTPEETDTSETTSTETTDNESTTNESTTDDNIQSGSGSEETETDDTSQSETSSETGTSNETETTSQNDSSSQTDTTESGDEDSATEETQVEEKQAETKEPEPVEVVEEVEEEPYTEEDFERDKKVALDLAMSRLSGSQISRLIDISSGGFTPTEKQEAKEMFYSNFTAAEQDWILGIYEKYYGLVSEG